MSAQKKLPCPTCKKLFEPNLDSTTMPFCSLRCKLADLNRWFEEEVGLPMGSSEPEDDEEEIAPESRSAPKEWRFE
jgi:endogenous inhibitor of DNA gyrase (YacG/DUF329 family)